MKWKNLFFPSFVNLSRYFQSNYGSFTDKLVKIKSVLAKLQIATLVIDREESDLVKNRRWIWSGIVIGKDHQEENKYEEMEMNK